MNGAFFLAACVAFCCLCVAAGANTYRRDLCNLDQHPLENVPTRADGFAECPPSFTAQLLPMEDGTMYGACFHRVAHQNVSAKFTYFGAIDCRKRCRELGGREGGVSASHPN